MSRAFYFVWFHILDPFHSQNQHHVNCCVSHYKTLVRDHSNKSYWEVLSCATNFGFPYFGMFYFILSFDPPGSAMVLKAVSLCPWSLQLTWNTSEFPLVSSFVCHTSIYNFLYLLDESPCILILETYNFIIWLYLKIAIAYCIFCPCPFHDSQVETSTFYLCWKEIGHSGIQGIISSCSYPG